MHKERDDDLDEFSSRLALAGINPAEALLNAAIVDFSDMKEHKKRVNETVAHFGLLESPRSLPEETDAE